MLLAIGSKFAMGGVIIDDELDTVVEAAPIFGYMIGRSRKWVYDYANKRGWETEVVYASTNT